LPLACPARPSNSALCQLVSPNPTAHGPPPRSLRAQFYGPSVIVSPDDLPKVSATWSSTVAIRNLLHWSQLYKRSSGLWMYDFGTDCDLSSRTRDNSTSETCNQAKYGQRDPPKYDLKQVKARAAVFEGQNDLMATKEDVAKLKASWSADLVFNPMYPRTAQ
jgi:hypothetical protein